MSLVREDWLKKNPGGANQWIISLREAAAFLREQPAASDIIVSKALNIPQGVLLKALQEGRIEFQIQPASQQRESLLEMLRMTADQSKTELSDSGLIPIE